MIARGEIEACARRVYELHRARDLRRRRSIEGRIPTWGELAEPVRGRLIAEYWRARSGYDAGREMPREVRIEPSLTPGRSQPSAAGRSASR